MNTMIKTIAIIGSNGVVGSGLLNRLQACPSYQVIDFPKLPVEPIVADIVVLCLYAKDAITWMMNNKDFPGVVIDTSSAFKNSNRWTYGLSELNAKQKEQIRDSKRIANPGCYATGIILLLRPLIQCGIISQESALSIFGIGGASTGGNRLVQQSQEEAIGLRTYALTLDHPHIPEIMEWTGIGVKPLFITSVVDIPHGMQIHIPIHNVSASMIQVLKCFTEAYENVPYITIAEDQEKFQQLSTKMNGGMNLLVSKDDGQNYLFTAQYDNLGMGSIDAIMRNIALVLERTME